jgi:hypothetical protein
MILILSIMAGFLEENRKMVRGSLSDLVVKPNFATRLDGKTVPAPSRADPGGDPRGPARRRACPQLMWFGMLAQGGRDAKFSRARLTEADLAGAVLVGIDVQDEFQTTELHSALAREPLFGRHAGRGSRPPVRAAARLHARGAGRSRASSSASSSRASGPLARLRDQPRDARAEPRDRRAGDEEPPLRRRGHLPLLGQRARRAADLRRPRRSCATSSARRTRSARSSSRSRTTPGTARRSARTSSRASTRRA